MTLNERSLENMTLNERSQSQRATYCVIHLYATCRVGKSTETETRLVGGRRRGGGEDWGWGWLRGAGFLLGVIKLF